MPGTAPRKDTTSPTTPPPTPPTGRGGSSPTLTPNRPRSVRLTTSAYATAVNIANRDGTSIQEAIENALDNALDNASHTTPPPIPAHLENALRNVARVLNGVIAYNDKHKS